MAEEHKRNTIRTFALVCVAVIAVFLMGVIVWYTEIISSPNWCDRAVGASKDVAGTARPEYAVGGCFNLLNQQVGAIAWNSHIFAITLGISLLVLVVIVLAGGRLSFKGSKDGIEADISRSPEEAADEVAGAATDKANEIKGEGA